VIHQPDVAALCQNERGNNCSMRKKLNARFQARDD
jgi:hypothetical protein